MELQNLIQRSDIKKIFFLGTAIVSTKIVLIAIAYFFDDVTYNLFNQAYYTSSVLILFGGLGFNIALTRIKFNISFLSLAVLINIVLTFIILNFIINPSSNTKEISLIIYSLFSVVGSVYVFKMLFDGKYFRYVFLTILYSLLHLLIIPLINIYKLDIYIVLPFISGTWFFISLPFFNSKNDLQQGTIDKLYKIGFAAFIINSAIPLAFVIDKFVVNKFFEIHIANAYTFAWGLTAPLFYLGNIVEKLIYSETAFSNSHLLKKGFTINLILSAVYALFALIVINLNPSLLPESVNTDTFYKIFPIMIAGYTAYVIFHFPINAFLFKVLETNIQKTIATSFSIIILCTGIIYYFLIGSFIHIDYKSLLLLIWIYIFTLLIVKSILMFKVDRGGMTESTILNK